MSAAKPSVPAIDGWFRGDPPQLLGTRCRKCGSVCFPRQTLACRNPACDGSELDEVPLSRAGRLWSWTTNHYAPPAPYVSPDPFVPYTVAAVELAAERMVVLGQLAAGVDPAGLELGMEMELVVEPLFEDAEKQHVVWKWRPA